MVLIDTAAFLATHDLAFKGKINAFESEDKEGITLLSLSSYSVEKDQRLIAINITIPLNATHTMPDMQNKLIAAMSSVITEVIIEKLEILGLQSKLMVLRIQLMWNAFP